MSLLSVRRRLGGLPYTLIGLAHGVPEIPHKGHGDAVGFLRGAGNQSALEITVIIHTQHHGLHCNTSCGKTQSNGNGQIPLVAQENIN